MKTLSKIQNLILILTQKDYAYVVGLGITLLLGLIYVTTVAFSYVGMKPGAPSLLASIAFTYYILFKTIDKKLLNFKLALIVPILLIVFSGFISSYILDASYDGLMYHQPAVLYLMAGWSPINENLPNLVWLNSYPKGSWMVGATLANVFLSVEAMKAQNILSITAAFFLTFSAIKNVISEIKLNHALLISLAIAANPVSLYQLFTGYNDGLLGSQITCLIALLCLSNSNHARSALVALLILIPFTVNIKFTAVPYVGLICLFFLIYLLIEKKWSSKKFTFFGISLSIGLGIVFFGANPYLTNMLQHGHPFYPLMGAEKIDIMSMNIPVALRDHGYIYKLFAGLFAAPISWIHGDLFFFSPLLPRPSYFTVFTGADIRIGGFGPLFGLIISLALIGVFLIKKIDRHEKLLIVTGLLIIFTVLINPESWWARYVPQLWLGMACIALSLIISTSALKRGLGCIVFALMITNSIGVGGVSLAAAISKSNFWRQTLVDVFNKSKDSDPLYIYQGSHLATAARLDRFNIRYLIVPKKSECKNPVTLLPNPKSYLSDALICSR